MAEVANLVVEEPGELTATSATAVLPMVTIDLAVAFAEHRSVQVEVSESAIAEIADTLHRIGGEALVRELSHALDARARDAPFAEATHASQALRLLEVHLSVLRAESMTFLASLDAAVRQQFELDLTLAAVEMSPQRFGIQVDQDGLASVAPDGPDHDRYRQLRSVVVGLDRLRRKVKRWSFTIPPNAPTARRQFEDTILGPYLAGLKAAAESYPALVTMAPRLLVTLEGERSADIAQWEADPGHATKLDEIIQTQVLETAKDLLDAQPEYRAKTLAGADRALASARAALPRYSDRSPAEALGQLHPLWRHCFLVQAAIDQQDYHPGDHGYAVAIDSLYAATSAQERGRQEQSEIDSMLGWASIGFGVLTLIPVVGEFALVAAIVVTAIQTLETAQKYAAETTVREALGHQAVPYDVPEPDAIGLITNVLSLTADAALPVIGKLITRTVLRPATRVLAATRVKTAVDLGQHASNLAALVISANGAQVERELRRLQLLTPETGRP